MRTHRLFAAVLGLSLGLTGCSTLKGWFTAQGHKLTEARTLEDQGHPLGASALAVEALALEPAYQEARTLLSRTFGPGQEEFRAATARWQASKDPSRWDRLVELYRWQTTLHEVGPTLPAWTDPQTKAVLDLTVAPVADELKEASRQAALWHLALARRLADVGPGPRQARKALAEGRVAAGYDEEAPDLADWLEATTEAATQRLLVLPFFYESGWKLGAISGPLGSEISRRLLEDPGLPELTTIFPSDRVALLAGGGLARIGLVSQPDALKLAIEAGQNLVLMGQLTRVSYQEPKKTVVVEPRQRQVTVVSPDHPEGVSKVWKAQVTTTTWTTSVAVSASFQVVEVATVHDLVTAVRDATASDRTVVTTYTGDKEALTPDDLRALAEAPDLVAPETLRDRALASLAGGVADVVRNALK